MERLIKAMEDGYLRSSLDFVEEVFAQSDGAEEGRMLRRFVEEIRAKKYYVPELELVMTDGNGELIGYAMFSRFHIEGRHDDELLLLSPVAVKLELQRQHISKDLIEYGFEKAKSMGFKAVLVEGNPKNYVSRGFQTSHRFGITAGAAIKLPHTDCLMAAELERGALASMGGVVDYSFYEAL